MPKKPSKSAWRGRGGRVNNTDNKHYFGHDDRGVRNDSDIFRNRLRVSFKPRARPIRDISRSLTLTNIHDDDVPMTISSDNNNRQVLVRGRGRGLSRSRNSPLPHRGFRGGPSSKPQLVPLREASCYKVIIPYGQKYTKDYIINNLLSYIAPETFVPIMFKILGNEAVFYVDDQKTANTLLTCDRKITMTDGFKLQVKVLPGFSQCEIDDKMKERLKHAMGKRYIQETNALDLSRFHLDPDLVTDYFCALFRPIILMTVLNIVSEHIPLLEALNLDGNKLQVIERLNVLHTKFEKLKILHLGDNKIRNINQIDVIKDLKLEELRLAGNPVCNKYKSRQNDYVSVNNKTNVSVIMTNLELPGFWLFFLNHSDVRKRFPKLLRLDGMELPRPILFDVVNDAVEVPSTKRIFTSNAKAQEVASQFLQQYFLIFDSENRQPLLNAYEEHACFSLTISTQNVNKLNPYLLENRNLFRINEPHKKQKLLKQGRLSVVSYITEMPRTKHYLNTFTMDISIITDGMMLITVTGMFKEVNDKDHPVRYFNRTFIIVPEGTGYCIRNEQIHISIPTEMQEKYINNHPVDAQMSSASSLSKINPTIQGAAPELSEDVKQMMMLTLSQQTKMNLEWSLKCLQEVQWNYENAVSVFQEFFKRGQIPTEAFTK